MMADRENVGNLSLLGNTPWSELYTSTQKAPFTSKTGTESTDSHLNLQVIGYPEYNPFSSISSNVSETIGQRMQNTT
jgi:hypothetical protein